MGHEHTTNPVKVGDLLAPTFQVYKAPAKCTQCGYEWRANSFKPDDGTVLRRWCDRCIDAMEARRRRIEEYETRKRQGEPDKDVVLRKPRRAGDDDRPPFDAGDAWEAKTIYEPRDPEAA